MKAYTIHARIIFYIIHKNRIRKCMIYSTQTAAASFKCLNCTIWLYIFITYNIIPTQIVNYTYHCILSHSISWLKNNCDRYYYIMYVNIKIESILFHPPLNIVKSSFIILVGLQTFFCVSKTFLFYFSWFLIQIYTCTRKYVLHLSRKIQFSVHIFTFPCSFWHLCYDDS